MEPFLVKIIKMFVSTEKRFLSLMTPWMVDGEVFATDGIVFISIPVECFGGLDRINFERGDALCPDLNAILEPITEEEERGEREIKDYTSEALLEAFKGMDGAKPLRCRDCDGEGTVSCPTCKDGDISCDLCNGSGDSKDSFIVEFEGYIFSSFYTEKIRVAIKAFGEESWRLSVRKSPEIDGHSALNLTNNQGVKIAFMPLKP